MKNSLKLAKVALPKLIKSERKIESFEVNPIHFFEQNTLLDDLLQGKLSEAEVVSLLPHDGIKVTYAKPLKTNENQK